MTSKYHNTQAGFALLMALLVVGVLVSIGLSILELSIKQIQLSTNARDSEIAFHAANAGVECARYWRRESAEQMERGEAINPICFNPNNTSSNRGDGNVDDNTVTALGPENLSGDGEAYIYRSSFTWGVESDRCTKIATLVASSSSDGADLVISGISNANLIPGYSDEGSDTKTCTAGTRCTILSVRGYNRPCIEIGNYGTVEREVLLQF